MSFKTAWGWMMGVGPMCVVAVLTAGCGTDSVDAPGAPARAPSGGRTGGAADAGGAGAADGAGAAGAESRDGGIDSGSALAIATGRADGGDGADGPSRPSACRLRCTEDADCCPAGVDCSGYPGRVVCLEGGVCAHGGCVSDAECAIVHGDTWGCFEFSGGRRCQQKCLAGVECSQGCEADEGGLEYCPPASGGVPVNPGGEQTECEDGCFSANKPVCVDGSRCGCSDHSQCVGAVGSFCDPDTAQCGCRTDDDCGEGRICDHCTADANGNPTCERQ